MSRFKRIKNKSTKKSSVSIDEKIAALNKELKKTGMLSEKMTTSNVYSTSEFVPYDPGGEFPVPDPTGVTGSDFTQPVSGNPDDPSNWPDAYTDNSWMYNPNEIEGESNRPIVATMDQGVINAYNTAFPDDGRFPSGGAGIVFGDIAFGTAVGFAKGGHFYQVLNPGLFGNGSTKIVPPGSPFGAPYFGLFGMYFPATPELANVIMAMSGAYAAAGGYNPSNAMPISLWRNHNLFHDGPFNDYGGKKYTDSEGKNYILQNFYLHNRSSNTYHVNPTPEHQTNVQTRGTEDPPIYPGPIASLFGLGQRAFEWLKEKAEQAVQAYDDFFSPVEAYLDATPPFLGFLIHQVNPNSPYNEENPFPVEIADDQKNEIKTEIQEIFNEWGSERVEEINGGSPMTNEEMNQVNEKINRNIKTGGNDATDSKFPSYRLTVNNIGNPYAFEGNIKTNKDGSKTPTAINDNYVFEGDDDASAPGAPTIIKTLLKNKGVQEAIKKSGLSYPYRVDDSPLPVGEKPILQNKNMPIKLNLTTPYDGIFEEKKPLSESVALGHFEPEELNVDIEDLRKGIMPEYPKQPPAEMIDGYHEKSRIRPKNAKNEEPYLKIDKTDLIRNHRLKSSEADEMMDTINMINDYIKKHPEDLIHAQMRYPVDDPRLAELNWKMDQMLDAGEEYLDSNFKENKKLFNRAMDRTKNNIKLTDPEYVQQHYDELRGTNKPKKTKLVGRLGKHLNKYESKSLFKHVSSKDFKKISERKLEKEKFLEKQEQKRLDYINDIHAEMDEFRSDWRNELKEQPAFKAVPIDTGKMTSSQSFAIFPNFPGSSDTGIRLGLDGGLGRDNSLASTDTGLGDPNFTGIFQFPTEGGGFVPAISFKAGGEINSAQISYGDFPLSGYAMPLGGKMSRSINQKKSEEINKELESSEEFTKKIEADALMKARVDSNIMTGNNLQDITTSFENVKVPFDQSKFSSYMRTNIEQFQISGAYEAEIEVLENKIRKTEEAQSKNYAAKIVKFEKQIKQIKEKQRKIPVDPKYPKTKISQAQFDALLKEISPADYIEGEEILKNNFLGQLEKQKEELNKKYDSLVKKYPQFNGDPERILGKWNGSVQIPIFDGDNNEIKPIGAEIGKQLEMIRLKKNIFNRMIYDSFDPSSVTYTMPPTISDTSEPSPKEMKSSGDDIKTIADLEKLAPEIIQQEINLDDVKSLEDLPQNKVLETIAKLTRFQTGGLSLPFDLTIKYAMGDYTPVTTSPGAAFDNVTLRAIENAHIKYPGRNSVSPDNYDDLPSRFAQAVFQHFNYNVTKKGIVVDDTFNFKDPNKGGSTNIGAFAAFDDYLPDKFKAQTIATNLVKIGDKRAEMLGYDPRDDQFGIPIKYLIPYSKLSQKQKKLFYPERFRNENKRGSAFSKIKKFRNK